LEAISSAIIAAIVSNGDEYSPDPAAARRSRVSIISSVMRR
jgi:hypothetical protein